MLNCIVLRKPLSVNSSTGRKRADYKIDIEAAFEQFHDIITPFSGKLYGVVYYFYKKVQKGQRVDADNLSKPIWDCLKPFLYNDDIQIKLRLAGSIDLRDDDFEELDISNLSTEIYEALIEAIENEEHILYIECGDLQQSMFKFNLVAHAN